MPNDFLLEIGCEELPSSFVASALAALPAIVARRLANTFDERRIGSTIVAEGASPRTREAWRATGRRKKKGRRLGRPKCRWRSSVSGSSSGKPIRRAS